MDPQPAPTPTALAEFPPPPRASLPNKGRSYGPEKSGKGGDHEDPFFCDACEKGFKTQWRFEEHVAKHMKCPHSGCTFEGTRGALNAHNYAAHSAHIAALIKALDTPEAIAKWREERKKNFPTKESVQKKEDEIQRRRDRGELIDKPRRFGDRPQRGGARGGGGGFDSSRGRGGGSARGGARGRGAERGGTRGGSRGRGGRGGFNNSESRDGGEGSGSDDDYQEYLEQQKFFHEQKAREKAAAAGAAGSSETSPAATTSTDEKNSEIPILQDENENENKMEVGEKDSEAAQVKKGSAKNVPGLPKEPVPLVITMNPQQSDQSNASTTTTTKTEEQEGESVEGAIMHHEDDGAPVEVSAKTPLPEIQMAAEGQTGDSASNPTTAAQQPQQQNAKKRKPCDFFQRGFCKHGDACKFAHVRVSVPPPKLPPPSFNQNSLLFKLLKKEIIREKSIILQCFRFMVHRDFDLTTPLETAAAPTPTENAVSVGVEGASVTAPCASESVDQPTESNAVLPDSEAQQNPPVKMDEEILIVQQATMDIPVASNTITNELPVIEQPLTLSLSGGFENVCTEELDTDLVIAE